MLSMADCKSYAKLKSRFRKRRLICNVGTMSESLSPPVKFTTGSCLCSSCYNPGARRSFLDKALAASVVNSRCGNRLKITLSTCLDPGYCCHSLEAAEAWCVVQCRHGCVSWKIGSLGRRIAEDQSRKPKLRSWCSHWTLELHRMSPLAQRRSLTPKMSMITACRRSRYRRHRGSKFRRFLEKDTEP
jgi:hypothetical protein